MPHPITFRATAPDAPLYPHCCGCDLPLAANPPWCPSCQATMPAYLDTSARPYGSFDGAVLSGAELAGMRALNRACGLYDMEEVA